VNANEFKAVAECVDADAKTIRTITAQRDALLAALKEFRAHLLRQASYGLNVAEVEMLRRGEAAIAAAEKGIK
jgi:hypothetical protein